MQPLNILIKNIYVIKELLADIAWRSELGTQRCPTECGVQRRWIASSTGLFGTSRNDNVWVGRYSFDIRVSACWNPLKSVILSNYSWTQLYRVRFVRLLSYSVTHSVVISNPLQGTCFFFFSFLSTTYIRARTLDITTLPIICSNVIFQDVGYFENSAISSSLRKQRS